MASCFNAEAGNQRKIRALVDLYCHLRVFTPLGTIVRQDDSPRLPLPRQPHPRLGRTLGRK